MRARGCFGQNLKRVATHFGLFGHLRGGSAKSRRTKFKGGVGILRCARPFKGGVGKIASDKIKTPPLVVGQGEYSF